MIKLNHPLAEQLNLDPGELSQTEGVEILAGNSVVLNSDPIAAAYAGHQFGHFVPQLGDGRALLLGEVTSRSGKQFDIQLKGSGRTPFSRGGDGRAVLGPVLREYIVSEAMAALGVPTTRALAVVSTGEQVLRETALPGAVLTRVASSHLRVGTFQYFAVRGDVEALKILLQFAIDRHYPELSGVERRCRKFLDAVIERQAKLVAQWMFFGFVHGVMNTDNTSISGETIDYGPCAFLEGYDSETVFSSIDLQGRYSYENQPFAMHWNLTRLAECLLPLMAEEEGSGEQALVSAREALDAFVPQYEASRLGGLREKLGLLTSQDEDVALAEDLLTQMQANAADFTLTFRSLCEAATNLSDDDALRQISGNGFECTSWLKRWRARLAAEPATEEVRRTVMRSANPLFIPRNHLVQEVIDAAYAGDLKPFETLTNLLTKPFDEQPGFERYALPARPEERVTQTFCGT